MSGRTVLVTGASGGIGYAGALGLAAQGAEIIAVSRDAERTVSAARRISEETGAPVHPVVADFADLSQVRAACADIAERWPRIDVLVNNAGAIYPKRVATVDGHELTWQVDYLAGFLLTAMLAGPLVAAAPSRVVTVSSDAHLAAWNGLDFRDLDCDRGWGSFRAYAASKLANIMFSAELARRWASRGVTSNAMHPGVVRTGFGRSDWDRTSFWSVLNRFYLSPEEGADTLVYLCSSPEVEGASGLYYYKRSPKRPSSAARDRDTQRRLWEYSVDTLGLADDPGMRAESDAT